MLAGKHVKDGHTQSGSRFDKNKLYLGRYWHDATFERVEALARVAQGAGLSLVELAYAWCAGRPGVSSILVGPATVAHLDAACDAVTKKVPEDALEAIDRLHVAWTGTESSYAR
jgi:aryl-alcohol dehydrogenase-like predicted oxidoreductase